MAKWLRPRGRTAAGADGGARRAPVGSPGFAPGSLIDSFVSRKTLVSAGRAQHAECRHEEASVDHRYAPQRPGDGCCGNARLVYCYFLAARDVFSTSCRAAFEAAVTAALKLPSTISTACCVVF